MTSSNGTEDHVWVIEKMDSGEWLGTRDRLGDTGLDFGGRVPYFLPTLRATRQFWLSFSCDRGYLTRGVTLPGVGKRCTPGPNFRQWPRVRFLKMHLSMVGFEVPTPEEMGLETTK